MADKFRGTEMQTMTQNQRQHERLATERPVKLRCGDSGRYIAGMTVNVSDGGVLLRMMRPASLRAGHPVQVILGGDRHHALLPAAQMVDACVVRAAGDTVALRYTRPTRRANDTNIVEAA